MNKGFTPEEEDARVWGDSSNIQQEMVLAGWCGTSGWSQGQAPSLCPLSDLGGISLVAVVSASEVAAGGWPSLGGPGAALDRARLGGWGGARRGDAPGGSCGCLPWLPQGVSVALPFLLSALPAHLAEALGLGCGSASYIWNPGGRRQARWAEGSRAT